MKYIPVITTKQFHNVWDNHIFEANLITFDIETNTLNRFSNNAKLVSVAIQARDTVYGFKVYNRNDDLGVEYSPEEVISNLKLLLESDATKVGHNLKFDLSFLHVVYGFDKSIFENIEDTLLLGYLTDENIRLNLDEQANYHLNIAKHKSMVDNKKLETEKLSLVLQYNMIDVDKTFQLLEYLLPKIKDQPKVYNCYKKEKLKMVYSFSKMENNGMLVNPELLQEKRKAYSKKLHLLQENYKKEIIKATGDKRLLSLKLTETEQLKEAFLKLGFELTALTKGGKEKQKLAEENNREFIPTIKDLTLDFDSLDDLLRIPKHIKDKEAYQKKIDKFIKPLLEFREDYTLYTRYFKGISEALCDDNKVRPNYNLTGTKTGRPACSNPNMMNIPRGPIVKDVFIAEPGYVLVEFDYSQGELRVAAIKSGDKLFIEAFKNGEDLHKKTAANQFKVAVKDVVKWMRAFGKESNFKLIYGASANAFYEALMKVEQVYNKVIDPDDEFDLSPEICQTFIDDFFKLYSGIKKYLDWVVQDTLKNGYSETCAGQRHHFHNLINMYKNKVRGAYGNMERRAKNYPIQGTLGQVMNYNISRITTWLEKENMKSKIIGTVYDSLLAQVYIPELYTFVDNAKYILENIPKSFMDCKGVPMSVDFKIGMSWGSMTEAELINGKIKIKE
jgi:DNA polymerase I